MKILFVHNNFPGQYRHLAGALARDRNNELFAVGSSTARPFEGVRLLKYDMRNVDVSGSHPFARRFELESNRAEHVLYALSSLAETGFRPEVILAHPGWGETLPLRAVFPAAQIMLYCEFFYGKEGRDVGFDPEFPAIGADGEIALRLKNAATLLALTESDICVSPTAWQRSTFHDGIDVDQIKPNPEAVFRLPSGRRLRRSDEVVTFVARNLEPLRGYHVFMRALPRILAKRPRAQIVVIGGDGVSYGASPPPGQTWKQRFLDEISERADTKRIHFTGRLPHAEYLRALQISSAHVYLTYPFVLSWSLLEALSAGCVVVCSETPPVQELIDRDNGFLVPFFDTDAVADRVVDALAHPSRFRSVRKKARQTILDSYDLHRICLPKMMNLLDARK
jgi:glycosyltransferase involved in cell wall biosynthesis